MHERGAAIVGVQNQWPRDAALGQHCLPDQDGRQACIFTLMNFPAHDLAAEDVDPLVVCEQTTAGQRTR